MAYNGYEVPIVLGQLGLQTDGAQSQLPPNAAILANNVTFFSGLLSKSNGTVRYNTTALGNPIIAGIDWWPTPTQQNMVVLTSNGQIWEDTGSGTFLSNTPLVINETQIITFSAVPTTGTITFKWNGNNATSATNWNDSLATIQSTIQTITGLSTATVYANQLDSNNSGLPFSGGHDGFAYGLTIVFTGTSSSQPLMTFSANSLQTTGSVAVTPSFAKINSGATLSGTLTTDTHLLPGGSEYQGAPRRLFIYTGGTHQLMMITGGSTANVTGINRPAADWANTYPTFGVSYINRHVAILGHNIYLSRFGDQTDFTTSATNGSGAYQFAIFPGEGDEIISAAVYKGGLLLFKRPFGVYLFQWNGQDPTVTGNLSITKLSDSFAIGSPHAAQQVLDDLIGGSSSGSLFSQKATNAYGSLVAGDVLQTAQVRNYFRQNFAYGGIPYMHSAFYPEKIVAMFTGRDNTANPQNRILMYDVGGNSPRISVETKDQPTCLFLRKDSNYVPRPFYGSNDGYVYQMDQSAWNVNGAAYTGEYQTPYIDMSFLEPKLADKVKLFDFLSITYQNIGSWAFYVDVYVDGVFCQTLTYTMKQSTSVLDSFVLDHSTLGSNAVSSVQRQRLQSCNGKAISLRLYNSVLNQSFTIERITLSFRESGEQNRSSK